MRVPLITGNWKMYRGGEGADRLARDIKTGIREIEGVDILFCPPFTALKDVYKVIENSSIKLGAQNCFYESEGAYTGEVSPLFLIETGCQYVILGHSERRKYFGDTDDKINKRLKTAIDVGLHTILCVGEELIQREAGRAEEVVNTQLLEGLAGLSEDYISKVEIAYEPVWAIGTGKTCEPDIAERMHRFIRDLLSTKFGEKIAEDRRILYGGSVKPENISSLIAKENIDGALVGGASLKPESFIEIVRGVVSSE
ncbi:triose-phosphate isomerase [candidate division WOR-3 bacterium]|nr:triose-phosphate isomerase [candidate division WOR-3 bacterium]